MSRPFLFVFQNFTFLNVYDFFSFSLTFQSTWPLKVPNRFTVKNSCIILGRASTKVVRAIVKFQSGDFFGNFV